jgi:peptidyl-prolyl cis-trans isomerase B (cyclophilin B)
MTDSNSTNQTPAQDGLPVSQMPIYAFVSSLLFAPVGLYFGHSALSEMKKGTISSSNKAWAQAALIIAYSFLALGLAALAYLIWLAATISGLLQLIPR